MTVSASRPAYPVLLTVSLLVALPLAAEESVAPVSTTQPRIGLVLGGGGAKGAAHIGVLRVLDELRIPISCVVGTSMGALVGATFAAGTPPEEIERQVLAINWSKTVGSEGLRDRTPINRKLAGITYTNSLDLGIKNGRIQGRGGLLTTQNIEDVIRGLVADARSTDNFDELPIPFRAVATDMLAGEMVVLSQGDLSVAMRASMAVPGAFSPVLMDGKVLADGGMMRNLPVDIARSLCADVVIAVSLESPPPVAADLNSTLGLASRSLDVMIEANQRAQLATLTERDVSIVVPMGDIGSASFERVPDAVPLGREAALGQQEQLRRYALPEGQYLAWRQAVSRDTGAPIVLADVQVTGLNRVNPEFVRAQLQSAIPGNQVTTRQIVKDTARVYALGDFERVEYVLTGPRDATTLEIRAVEKSWGPNFVRFDLGFTANGVGDLEAVLRADFDQTWVNQQGAEWRSAIQFGKQTLLQTSFYQPLDIPQRFFVEPLVAFDSRLEDLYDNGDRVAVYVIRQLYGQLDAGMNLGTRAQVRAGLRTGWLDAEVDTGATILPELNRETDSSAQLRFVYDTRDQVSLATRGTFLNARLVSSGAWLGGEQSYGLAEGVLTKSYPFRGDALTLLVGGGKRLNGDLPPTEEFQLGGIRTFPGLQNGELRGDSYWIAGSRYNWKIADIQSLFGQAIYAGLRLQAGRMGNPIDDSDDGSIYGVSGSLGANTPLGPIVLSLGYVDNGSWGLQLGIGRPIAEGSILDEVR